MVPNHACMCLLHAAAAAAAANVPGPGLEPVGGSHTPEKVLRYITSILQPQFPSNQIPL
jgi:hypothetical protein